MNERHYERGHEPRKVENLCSILYKTIRFSSKTENRHTLYILAILNTKHGANIKLKSVFISFRCTVFFIHLKPHTLSLYPARTTPYTVHGYIIWSAWPAIYCNTPELGILGSLFLWRVKSKKKKKQGHHCLLIFWWTFFVCSHQFSNYELIKKKVNCPEFPTKLGYLIYLLHQSFSLSSYTTECVTARDLLE